MIKFENTEVMGWEHAIRGMRNPMNSWEKTDSVRCYANADCPGICIDNASGICIGENDLDLMTRLCNAGTDHRKFMRMITVYVDITAPLYWWKEFDTYKVGTVANSCSTMHKIHEKKFEESDFSVEYLFDLESEGVEFPIIYGVERTSIGILHYIIHALNFYRKKYLDTKDKKYWWQMIQLLPSSYNQKRTVMMNYEVLANIYKSRRNHKLDQWCLHDTPPEHEFRNKDFTSGMWGFCDWIETLPYSELITGKRFYND